MNFDSKTGIIEMFMDSLEITDEGTFTFNLVDGKATGRTSLVLIGKGKVEPSLKYIALQPLPSILSCSVMSCRGQEEIIRNRAALTGALFRLCEGHPLAYTAFP